MLGWERRSEDLPSPLGVKHPLSQVTGMSYKKDYSDMRHVSNPPSVSGFLFMHLISGKRCHDFIDIWYVDSL